MWQNATLSRGELSDTHLLRPPYSSLSLSLSLYVFVARRVAAHNLICWMNFSLDENTKQPFQSLSSPLASKAHSPLLLFDIRCPCIILLCFLCVSIWCNKGYGNGEPPFRTHGFKNAMPTLISWDRTCFEERPLPVFGGLKRSVSERGAVTCTVDWEGGYLHKLKDSIIEMKLARISLSSSPREWTSFLNACLWGCKEPDRFPLYFEQKMKRERPGLGYPEFDPPPDPSWFDTSDFGSYPWVLAGLYAKPLLLVVVWSHSELWL